MLRLLFLFLVISATRSAEIVFDFTKVPLDEAPSGFQSVVGGGGQPGEWRIITADVPAAIPSITAAAPVNRRAVLAQLSRDSTDEHYPMLIYTNEILGDFTFSTRVKCVEGNVEQMAGVVFRYQDEQNHYYVRASAKGNTFRFFKLVGGQRSAPIGPEIQIPAGEWHELTVECKANQINCFLNGKQVIPTLTDTSFSAGRIGFWTKSDSVSYFTDARIQYTPRESLAKVLLREMHQKYPRVLAMRLYATPPGKNSPAVIASTSENDLNLPATHVETTVLEKDDIFFGRLKPGVVVTLPLHDRNGETIAALRVEMKSFVGQTENNAVARATPIAKEMESRLAEAKDLF